MRLSEASDARDIHCPFGQPLHQAPSARGECGRPERRPEQGPSTPLFHWVNQMPAGFLATGGQIPFQSSGWNPLLLRGIHSRGECDMLTSIIVPLDGSDFAERALPYATRLCQATRAQLSLVQAAYVTVPVTNASAARMAAERLKVVVREAEDYLTQVAHRLEAAGQPAVVRVHKGAPTTAVTQEVADLQANLIVMTTHGRTGPGRAIFGSVANDLLHRAPVPILLVPANAESSWPTDRPLRLLVPLDGSAHGETILGPAAELADALKADLLLVLVADHHAEAETREYLEQAARSLRTDVRAVNGLALEGHPATAILRAAQEERAAVIAMATHGRTGLARLVMGSVAEAVVRSATIPILVVRPPSLHIHTDEDGGPPA